MKRFLLAAALIFAFALPVFSQKANEPIGTLPDDGVVTNKPNGAGDQYIKVALMANFPLNFQKQMYIGGAAHLGYFRFLNSWLAVGGELMAGYNLTLGSNVFTFIPVTFGATAQPTIWRFEFPTTLTTGFAFETSQNKKYFPGFVLKAEAATYYRFMEGWSFGLGTNFLYLPQWHTTTENAKPDYGLFMTAQLAVRYHF